MSKALLYDSTMCIGCKQCEQGCADENKLHYDETVAAEQRQSDHKYTVVLTKGEKFMRRLCMNCEDPACASVCPVGALRKTAAGPVTYDADRCMGCRYCMVACPFSVPRYEWSKAVPAVRKCDGCIERQQAGKINACAEACPAEATVAGTREELLAEARRRIAANPGAYHPEIYGEHEVGGTNVFVLSPVPFEQLGMRVNLGTEPLPNLTWAALSKIPKVVGMGCVGLSAIYWITHRRQEVAAAEGRSKENR